MFYRSTNAEGRAQHSGGAFVSGVEFGSGIELNPTSSGAAPVITVAGDESAKDLKIQGKGTGGLRIGSASTTAITVVQRYFVEATVPALAAGASAESTVTVSGLTTNSILMLQNRLKLNSTVTGVRAEARCSTADELTIEFANISASTLSGSTVSFYLLRFGF